MQLPVALSSQQDVERSDDAKRHDDGKLRSDLRLLADFVTFYCVRRHADRPRVAVTSRTHDVPAIAGRSVELCDECRRLLLHAFVKRSRCPMDPKPQCKHCPSHCYHPKYRAQIRQVMAFSGRGMVLRGRLDYLLHLLF